MEGVIVLAVGFNVRAEIPSWPLALVVLRDCNISKTYSSVQSMSGVWCDYSVQRMQWWEQVVREKLVQDICFYLIRIIVVSQNRDG